MFSVGVLSNNVTDDGESYSYSYGGGLGEVSDAWPEVFGFYAAYFIGFCIVAAIVDCSGFFDGFIAKLSHSAYTNFRTSEKLHVSQKEDPEMSNEKMEKLRNDHDDNTITVEDETCCAQGCCHCCSCCSRNRVVVTRESFSAGFLEYILDGNNCYFGCADLLFKGGFSIGILCCKLYTFPAGMMVGSMSFPVICSYF